MANWPTLFIIRQFFEPLACDAIVAELKFLDSSAATVYGRRQDRSIKTYAALDKTIELVKRRLWSCKEAVEKHFEVTLNECEEPQFLCYREGDFFVAHQDGNTDLLRLDTELRRISTVVFLSREAETPEPNAYRGGSLVFSDLRNRFHMLAEPGTLVAFRSETTHEVTPVTHGERYSIASWYR